MVAGKFCERPVKVLHGVSYSAENLLFSSIVNPEGIATEVWEKLKGYKNPAHIKLQAGKYIALAEKEIVASGASINEAEKAARRKGVSKFILLRIPNFRK